VFIQIAGERFRVLQKEMDGAWIISYDEYQMPIFINQNELNHAKRISTPDEYIENIKREKTNAQQQRYELLRSVIEDRKCITDESYRSELFKKIANENNTTVKRLRRLYYYYLAWGTLTKNKPRKCVRRMDFEEAIRKYYFSAKRNSLRTTYELYILDKHTNQGIINDNIPSWYSFRLYYYRHFHNNPQKEIAREGLTYYQRNSRPLHGSAMQYRRNIGCYQIDETQGDIYLVSKWDRSQVIGRPNIYLAIDVASGLIAGIYVGLDAGENAMMACIANAAMSKAKFCSHYSIKLDSRDWPSQGLPSEIISDRGAEFTGERIDELCLCYGIDRQVLPPFRAEEKPLVERANELIQDSYKSMLRGRGVIGEDAMERWSKDYRKQAILTLEEYTSIVIHVVIALNKSRILTNIGHLPVEAPNTPARLWSWLRENEMCDLLDVDEEEIYCRSLPRKTSKVTRKGIIFNGMRYLPENRSELIIGKKIEFAYDKQNTKRIFVLDDNKRMIPCNLASSCSRYAGYDMTDITLIHADESKRNKSARQKELEAKVVMREKIEKIILFAETQRTNDKQISEIQTQRKQEKERLT